MAKVSIYLDTRSVSATGESPIKLAISHQSKTALISIGIRVKPNQWDDASKQVRNHPNKSYLNTYLLSRRLEVESALLQIVQEYNIKQMTATEIKEQIEYIINPDKRAELTNANTFVSRFERFMSLKDKEKTIAGYKWTLGKLREFDPNIEMKTFEDISIDYLKEFIAWCQHSINRNSMNVHMRYIRAVFNDAIDAKITRNYPFRRLSLRPLPVKKKALTPEQMKTLMSADCEPWQEEYRDMFMLMFLLRGINIGDMLQAKPDQIVNGRLEYRRNKVGTLFSVRIEPEARAIIDKYKGTHHILAPLDRYGSHLDYLHHLNHALKTIGCGKDAKGGYVGAGLFPQLSSNWARHSWASAGARIDIPKDTISRGMGHSFGVAVTDIYIDFDMKKVDDANRKIIDYIYYGKDYRKAQ